MVVHPEWGYDEMSIKVDSQMLKLQSPSKNCGIKTLPAFHSHIHFWMNTLQCSTDRISK